MSTKRTIESTSSTTSPAVLISAFTPAVPASTVGIEAESAAHDKSGSTVEKAVYGYLKAVRALGRTGVNTIEIANALALDLAAVERSIEALKKKGVKVASP